MPGGCERDSEPWPCRHRADPATTGCFDELAEEFAERFRRGERPSLQEYVDRYPELADEIRELFPALVEVEQAEEDRQPRREPAVASTAARPLRPGGRLPDRSARSAAAAWGWSTRPSRSRSAAAWRSKVLPRQVVARTARRWSGSAARRAPRRGCTTPTSCRSSRSGQDGDVGFYAMQFIQGQGLDVVIDELRRLRDRAHPDRSGHAELEPAGPGRSRPGRRRPPRARARHGQPDGPVAPDRPVRCRRRRLARETPRPPAPDRDGHSRLERSTRSPMRPRPRRRAIRRRPPRRARPRRPCCRAGRQLSAVESRPAAVLPQRGPDRPAGRGRAWPTPMRGGSSTATSSRRTCCSTPPGSSGSPTSAWPRPSDDGLTQTGDILGTLRYMAPERFRGEGDARADVYALGLTLYELLTLRPAFDSPDRLQLIEQIKAEEPARPRALDPRIPRDLETIVLKAIDKDPEAPLRDGRRDGRGPAAVPRRRADPARGFSSAERLLRWARRNPAVATLGVAHARVPDGVRDRELAVAGVGADSGRCWPGVGRRSWRRPPPPSRPRTVPKHRRIAPASCTPPTCSRSSRCGSPATSFAWASYSAATSPVPSRRTGVASSGTSSSVAFMGPG